MYQKCEKQPFFPNGHVEVLENVSRQKGIRGARQSNHLDNNRSQKGGAKVYLDRTGVSGSRFLQK